MGTKEKMKAAAIVIDGFEINAPTVTYHKLQEFALILYEKLLVQRGDRNFLTMERDRLRTILENTRHEILVAEETTRNTEREIEKAEERFRREKKEVEQEVKWLLYDHGTNLAELKTWEDKELDAAERRVLEEELELLRVKREKKEELLEKERKLLEERENLKNVHQKELEELMRSQEAKKMENEMQCKRKLFETIEHINLKHEMEMSEIEERKNTHLVELKQIHSERLEETKSYFNSVTAEHLAVISNLKQNIEVMKKNKYTMSDEVKHLKEENRTLKGTLEKLKSETKNLNRQVINYEKDVLSLKNNKRMLKQAQAKTKELKKESNKVMRRICNDGLKVGDNLDKSCFNSMLGFKNIALDKRKRLESLIKSLVEDLKRKQKMISELSADPDVGNVLKELKFKFWSPNTLIYELTLICKAYDKLLDKFNRKLVECGLPEKELGNQSSQMKDNRN